MAQTQFDPDAITKKISDVKDAAKEAVSKGAANSKDKVVSAINGIGDAIGSQPPSDANKAGVI